MFLCSPSMKAHAFSSPINCNQAETVRYPVPDEFGFGMTM